MHFFSLTTASFGSALIATLVATTNAVANAAPGATSIAATQVATAPQVAEPRGATAVHADEQPALPALPATPAAIDEVIVARPFVVLEPWASDWCAERAEVERGWVVIIRASHALVVPRQTQEPVLLAGARVAERVMSVPESNLILAIIPATPRADAVPGHAAGVGGKSPAGTEDESMRPLAELAIWFGTPGLPEQVDRAAVEHEIALANTALVTPRTLEEVVRALKQGGGALAVADRAALLAAIEPWARGHGVELAPSEGAAEVNPAPGQAAPAATTPAR